MTGRSPSSPSSFPPEATPGAPCATPPAPPPARGRSPSSSSPSRGGAPPGARGATASGAPRAGGRARAGSSLLEQPALVEDRDEVGLRGRFGHPQVAVRARGRPAAPGSPDDELA